MKEYPDHIRLPQHVQIKDIISETKDVKTFYFEVPDITKHSNPGQFLMIYVYNHLQEDQTEEIPMSISYINKDDNTMGITVKQIGNTTRALHKHQTGENIGVRGPYGQGYNYGNIMNKNIGIVAGGTGIASLTPLLNCLQQNNNNITVFLGVANKDQLYTPNEIKDNNVSLYISTDDGSKGYNGLVTDLLEKQLQTGNFQYLFTCGPEIMMRKVLTLSNTFNIPIQASLERNIQCGRGLCGSCVAGDKCICREGPVFMKDDLNRIYNMELRRG